MRNPTSPSPFIWAPPNRAGQFRTLHSAPHPPGPRSPTGCARTHARLHARTRHTHIHECARAGTPRQCSKARHRPAVHRTRPPTTRSLHPTPPGPTSVLATPLAAQSVLYSTWLCVSATVTATATVSARPRGGLSGRCHQDHKKPRSISARTVLTPTVPCTFTVTRACPHTQSPAHLGVHASTQACTRRTCFAMLYFTRQAEYTYSFTSRAERLLEVSMVVAAVGGHVGVAGSTPFLGSTWTHAHTLPVLQ